MSFHLGSFGLIFGLAGGLVFGFESGGLEGFYLYIYCALTCVGNFRVLFILLEI